MYYTYKSKNSQYIKYYTYIIKCLNSSYYTGITTDIDRRLKNIKQKAVNVLNIHILMI